MRIDDRAEPLVRAAIHAAVKQDFGKLDQSMRAFTDDELARNGVELTLAVILFVLQDIHGGRPDNAAIREVANEIAEDESWSKASAGEATAFLSRLVAGEPMVDVFSAEETVVLAYVCAGHLLSSNRQDSEKWWNYLDRAEAAIEAAG
ncbi:hypothetical protein AB0H63_24060 [Micromonospora echinospora]|uniref:hypothetical protein n=1 Tax=Micromonospora echinospora TaxID=1877 RepID=UPI0033CDE4AF